MQRNPVLYLVIVILGLLVTACQPGQTSTPERVVVTEVVTQMVEGEPVEVEVTRIVEVQPSAEPAEQVTRPNILRIGIGLPFIPDPHRAIGGRNINVLENMYEPLAYPFRDTQEIRPVLADSWEVNEDGSVWTFTLKEGIEFHDGSPLTSADVKYSYERMMDIGEALQEDELNRVINDISTPDDQTVVFSIDPSGAPFLAVQTAVLIVSKETLEANATEDDPWAKEWMTENSAGTGPYMLAEFRVDDFMRIVRFDGYWRGWEGNHVDEAQYFSIPEDTTHALMLERGELDISFYAPLESVDNLRENPNLKVFQERGNYIFMLRMMNHSGPPSDPKIRAAISHAMDYEAFIEARDDYFPPEGPIPSHFLDGYVPDNLPQYDLELAQQLLEEAGYGPNNPLMLRQFILPGEEYQRIAAEILQQGLEQVGVTYEIIPGDFFAEYRGILNYMETGDESGYWDMFVLRMPAVIPDPVAYSQAYRTGNTSFNFMGYSNPEVDDLIDQATAAPDLETRISYLQEAAQIIVDDRADVWMGVERRTAVMGADVEGFYSHPIWWPAVHIYPISLINAQ